MHKVEAPPLVRQREHRCGRPRTDRPAPVASSPDHQSLLSIQTLGLLPVDHHALPAQQDVQASITEPAALLRQLAQLLPNIGIVTTLRPVAHALPIGPCDTARPPLAHPMASLEMGRSEEHTSELQSLMRSSYAIFCLKKKK